MTALCEIVRYCRLKARPGKTQTEAAIDLEGIHGHAMASQELGKGLWNIRVHADVPCHPIAAAGGDQAQGRIRTPQQGSDAVGRTVAAYHYDGVIAPLDGFEGRPTGIVIPVDQVRMDLHPLSGTKYVRQRSIYTFE